MNRYRIDIVTKGPEILGPEATGLVEFIQVVRAIAEVDGESTSHVVVRGAKPPFLLESRDEAIQKLFPDAVVSLVHADVAGAATISSSATSARVRSGAAAVVAAIKRCFAWDESPTIIITFETGGDAFRLNPILEDGVWWVVPPA